MIGKWFLILQNVHSYLLIGTNGKLELDAATCILKFFCNFQDVWVRSLFMYNQIVFEHCGNQCRICIDVDVTILLRLFVLLLLIFSRLPIAHTYIYASVTSLNCTIRGCTVLTPMFVSVPSMLAIKFCGPVKRLRQLFFGSIVTETTTTTLIVNI